MTDNKIKGKGVRVVKGQSAIDAMKERIPHWIHDTKKDDHYMNGIVYLPSCTCSSCGFHSSREKEYCPHCGEKMNVLSLHQ